MAYSVGIMEQEIVNLTKLTRFPTDLMNKHQGCCYQILEMQTIFTSG